MASTKYRKRAKSTDAPNKGTKAKDESARAYNEVLGPSGSENVSDGIEPKIESPTEKEYAHRPTIKKEEPSAPTIGSEDLIDSVKVEDEKNLFEMKLTRKANRLIRLAFYFNGIEVKPSTYGGINAGSAFFNLLKNTTKKG